MKNILLIACIVFVLFIPAKYGNCQELVYTTQDPTVIREQPEDGAAIVLELPQSTQLIVLEKLDSWIKVLHETSIGYIALAHIAYSPPTSPTDGIPFNVGELREEYYENKERMTKVAFKSWWETTEADLLGQRVSSGGYILAAKDGWLEGLHAEIEIDPYSDKSMRDIILLLDEEKHNAILVKLIKGIHIEFTGRIESITAILGDFVVRLDDVELNLEEQPSSPLSENTSSEQVHESTTPSQPQLLSPDFLEPVELFEQYRTNKETMTKAAFETWWEQLSENLQNKEALQGEGYIVDANEGWGNKLSLDINASSPEKAIERADRVQYKLYMNAESDSNIIAPLHKNDKVVFTGKVTKLLASRGSFTVEMDNIVITTVDELTPERADLSLPETSSESPVFLNFIELQKQYEHNEEILTQYGFNVWNEHLSNAMIDHTVQSQGVILEAKERGEASVEIRIDLHGDLSEDVFLNMDKQANLSTITQLNKDQAIVFGGKVSKFKLNSTKVSIELDEGQIVNFLADAVPQQDGQDFTAISKDEVAVEFDEGFLNDAIILTNNSGRNLNKVNVKLALDSGIEANDSIPVWLNYGKRIYEFSAAKRAEVVDIEFSSNEGTFSYSYRTGYIRPTPTPVPVNTPTPIPRKIPTAKPTRKPDRATPTPRNVESDVSVHTVVVMAETLIKKYIVDTHGFAERHIKFGRKLANDKVTALSNGQFVYANELRYKNAFGADMEGYVRATVQQLGDGETWRLQDIEFR